MYLQVLYKDVEKGNIMEKTELIPFLETLKGKSVILKNSGYQDELDKQNEQDRIENIEELRYTRNL